MAERGGAREWVFGYGSLLERRAEPPPLPCELRDHRRAWNVAMDNTQTIAGYKYYVDAATGERPDSFVVFLNVVPEAGRRVNGVMFEVGAETLVRLDARERNYERAEVTADISPPVEGRVWTYRGSPAAIERFELGLRSQRAVISREYRQGVLDDFARFGPEHVSRFEQTTDPLPCPVADLHRVDL